MFELYVPIYSVELGVSEGPLYNFRCMAEDREHAIEQARDSIKDDPQLLVDNFVWRFDYEFNQVEVAKNEVLG